MSVDFNSWRPCTSSHYPQAKFSLNSWVVLPMTIALLATIVFGIVFRYRQSLEQPRREMDLIMSQSRIAWQQLQESQKDILLSHLAHLAGNGALIAAYKARDFPQLLGVAKPMADQLRRRFRVTHFYFVDPDRTCFLRAHHPTKRGDRINRHSMLAAARTGKDAWGLELGPLGSFTLRYVMPWRVDGELLGYLELGMEIEHLIDQLAAILEVEMAAIVHKRFLQPDQFAEGRTVFGFPGKWDDYPGFVVAHQTMPELPPSLLDRLRRGHGYSGGPGTGPTQRADRWWWCGMLPQPDADNRPVADFILLRDVSQAMATARHALLREAGLGLLLAAGILLLLRLVTNRAERLLAGSFAAIRSREQLLAITLDSIGDAVISTDADGKVTRMNPVAEHLTGWRQSAARQRPLSEIFQLIDPTGRQVEDPVIPILTTGKPEGYVHHTILRSRDKNSCRIAANTSPILDQHGNTLGVILVFRDISKEQQAREETERIRLSLENAQRLARLGNWDWDIKNNTLYWSKEIYRMFGMDPQNFTPDYEAFIARIHPADREMVQQAVTNALRANQPYNIEHRLIRPSGETGWVHEQGEVQRDAAGHPLRMVGTVQDITKRREIEARERQTNKMQAIGLLAGGIAHDFNNLLTPIMMHADMALRQSPSQSRLKHHLAGIRQAAQRAASLVRQILAFGRKGEIPLTPTRLNGIIREATRFLQAAAPANVSIGENIQTGQDKVAADPSQLLQILMNLGINGIHAIGNKEGVVTISLEETAMPEEATSAQKTEAASWIKLSVDDNGCGIEPENLTRIFDPFFTTKKKGEGTGLGLAVVHGIVARHGGVLRLESKPGEGSCFKIYLPTCVAETETASQSELPHLGKGERILLVDDNPALRDSVAKALEQLGYRVITAANGTEALDFFQHNDIDLLLTDYDMPGLKGTELALAARKIRPGLPVVLCSGGSWPLEEESIQEYGISVLLSKPLGQELLGAEIHRLLAEQGDRPEALSPDGSPGEPR